MRTAPARRATVPVVLGPDGLPARRASVYENAGHGRRFQEFYAPVVGPNAAVGGSLETLRARSRACLRNHPLLWRAFRLRLAHVVGTGIKPQSQLPDRMRRKALHELWLDWTDEADADARTDFYGLQFVAMAEVFAAGEVFARLRPRRREDGLVVPLQVQLLQGEQCPISKNEVRPNGNVIRQGIEFDGIGRRVAYWMTRRHPYDDAPVRAGDLELVRVPAEQVLHLYECEAPGQLRGVPMLARIVLRAHDKDVFDDATMMGQKMAAMFAAFVTNAPDGSSPLADLDDDPLPTMNPGLMLELEPGQDVKFPTLPNMGAQYRDFQTYQDRYLAAGCGTTYEQLSGDYGQVNYSSGRLALLDIRRWAEQLIYATMCPAFNTPIWRAWLDQAALTGAVALPELATVPSARAARRVRWLPQAAAWVDPEKDARAKALMVRNGFVSRSSVVAELGEDPEAVEQEIADEQRRADALGLVFDSDGRRASGAGATPTTPDEPMPAEEAPRGRKRATMGGRRRG